MPPAAARPEPPGSGSANAATSSARPGRITQTGHPMFTPDTRTTRAAAPRTMRSAPTANAPRELPDSCIEVNLQVAARPLRSGPGAQLGGDLVGPGAHARQVAPVSLEPGLRHDGHREAALARIHPTAEHGAPPRTDLVGQLVDAIRVRHGLGVTGRLAVADRAAAEEPDLPRRQRDTFAPDQLERRDLPMEHVDRAAHDDRPVRLDGEHLSLIP